MLKILQPIRQGGYCMKKRIMMNMVIVILTISMILSMSVNAYAADIDDDIVIPEETVDLDAETLKII